MKAKTARKLNLKFYFTGKPCPKGHVCNRFARNNDCYQCTLDRAHKRHDRVFKYPKDNPLVFTEKGLLEAVRGIECRYKRVAAMCSYYRQCMGVARSPHVKEYIQEVIDGLLSTI